MVIYEKEAEYMTLYCYLLRIYDEFDFLTGYEIVIFLGGDAVEVLEAVVQKDKGDVKRGNDWLRKDPNCAKCIPASGLYGNRRLVLEHMSAKFV
ncbi:hypothetical protein A2662_00845 [Candidatus Giovannonibacteria bacterium RIFCSPHIGHO2_01_FULL_45_33]|uniref:Uncharacterized protein n=1 Tax=Candidatus Giovannonibacteria bacterium RIFCSPLOWO2_01_FULL_45_34 TaxID=1798351 RepID=A0A1F5WY46_9BACT|nr:MAG: hypothetical protein A2662_00845 [Candidatus Giovannonibacteria bacterium RIFCSPHIGHO2_01_FULL_45_33]OGF70861.1 MAG: hypothetical protein A3C73_02170 [Candidatus Giovannonibacteria bacterium RIFCSPHIGHO2_02_FULL_44_11]OGF80523.1 MAG: hypothetical protein A2930_02740 [Candidatus Giovannonibacteria bacterium RIFCSPLOWO2_01_FULL_45_34]